MRRRVAVVFLVVVALTIPAEAKRRAVAPSRPSPETSPYLTEAVATAEWITSLERASADGRSLSWAATQNGGGGWIGIDSGAAGIGSFFLRLYRTTNDTRWLDKAERGARHVANEFRAGRFASHEWLGGAAGAGHFLLEIHHATNAQEYLEAAHLAGDFLIRTAIVEGDGVYWKHSPQMTRIYTGIAHGAAGAAMFLVELYEASGDSRYLDTAERTVRWLATHTLELPNEARPAITWKRLTTDSAGYNGWCGGSMGIALLLDALHRATGKAEYRDTWFATAEGLWIGASRPRKSPLEIGWVHAPTIGSNRNSLGTAYCHGTPSNALILADAATRAGGERYSEAAAAAGRWLDRVAVPFGGGALWPQFVGSEYRETGLLTGTASVGHGSLELYAWTRDRMHLDRALAAGDYLLAVADHPQPGHARWLNRFDDSHPAEYRTGWYSGAAGIGIFLVELHDALGGRIVTTGFSPLHP